MIKTESEYELALKRIEALLNAGVNTPEGNELDHLVSQVEAYEAEHYPIDTPDPRYELAAVLFDHDSEAAWRWLHQPCRALGEVAPLDAPLDDVRGVVGRLMAGAIT